MVNIQLSQLVSAVPLPALLLTIVCTAFILLVSLVLLALFPHLGTTLAELITACRSTPRTRRRRTGSRAKQQKRQTR